MEILLVVILFIIAIWFLVGAWVDANYQMFDEGPFWKMWVVSFIIGGPFMGLIAFPLREFIGRVVDVLSWENLRNWIRK